MGADFQLAKTADFEMAIDMAGDQSRLGVQVHPTGSGDQSAWSGLGAGRCGGAKVNLEGLVGLLPSYTQRSGAARRNTGSFAETT
jgi:hypothetical protein